MVLNNAQNNISSDDIYQHTLNWLLRKLYCFLWLIHLFAFRTFLISPFQEIVFQYLYSFHLHKSPLQQYLHTRKYEEKSFLTQNFVFSNVFFKNRTSFTFKWTPNLAKFSLLKAFSNALGLPKQIELIYFVISLNNVIVLTYCSSPPN